MLDEKYIVEKSKALVWAQFQDYSPGELKILDTYLSRINPREPDASLVTFTKKEYAELMGLDSDIRTEQLKTYTGGLLSNVVTIDLPDKGYVQYPLFSEAKCYLDEKSGQVTIEVDCNHKLKPAFFDIARNGYVRYQLKNIINLKSQYSVRLYPKLKDRPFGWTISVTELRELLGATASSYDVFKDFNKHVLQKAVKEINDITDISVTTENIRKGRSVESIRFTVLEKSPHIMTKEEAECFDEVEEADVPGREEVDENQVALPEVVGTPDATIGKDIGDPTELFRSVFGDGFGDAEDPDDPLALCICALPASFSREQVELLRLLAVGHMPYEIRTLDEKDRWLHDYLFAKTKLMQATPGVMNPFAWMRKAVMEDWN